MIRDLLSDARWGLVLVGIVYAIAAAFTWAGGK